jgi:hypothetical protein
MESLFLLLEGLFAFFITFGVEIVFLVGMLVFAALVAGVLAPLHVLGWWAGWSDDHGERAPPTLQTQEKVRAPQGPAAGEDTAPRHYLVFLSGIGNSSAEALASEEQAFLGNLKAAMPWVEILDDIFAYSPDNTGLTDEERYGSFWRSVLAVKASGGRAAAVGNLINLRNMLQVAVSADRRYAPVFNYGTAKTIFEALLEVGYRPGAGVPVTLMGYSGGGQVVFGAARFLKPAIGAPLQVLSLGGVMASTRGIAVADELIHLEGSRDSVAAVADTLFWGRWPIARSSHWNRALAAGKLRRITLGPMVHTGPKGYLDPQSFLPDGQSYMDKTTTTTVELITAFRTRYAGSPVSADAVGTLSAGAKGR